MALHDDIKAEGRDFAKFLQALPEEERVRGNEINLRHAEAEFKQFNEAISDPNALYWSMGV